MSIESCRDGRHEYAAGLIVATCKWCRWSLSIEKLLDTYVEHERMVEVGVAVVVGELEALRADLAAAAGELRVPISEMAPGTLVAKLVSANVLLRRERDDLRSALVDLREVVA